MSHTFLTHQFLASGGNLLLKGGLPTNDRLIALAEELIPRLIVESVNPSDPVIVHAVPEPWAVLGTGNYTAVVVHPEFPDWVVKVYAPGRPGLAEEAEVYRRIGRHPAYSECLHVGDSYLILRRIPGITLYDCLIQGLRIPEQVIKDVEEALEYARSRGLHPIDVHAKNVMVHEGRGFVADISDFGRGRRCRKWSDLKKAYYRLYRPLLSRWLFPVPEWILNGIRKGYRLYRHLHSS